ncbi:MAG: hypothetical protein JW395_4169 [Nitrospira sp.]|nr:hypothetical protein [Nitrospira sp.]
MELHPALQGKLGSWKFYSTKMTARALAANVKFASEVWDAKALNLVIQRMLKETRAMTDIASYLAQHEDHFFNSIVVAAIEGSPTFFAVNLTDDPRFEMIADKKFSEAFGVLRFDGSQQYYALDGQHRLRAIRALLDSETEYTAPKGFEDEEFSVLIVVPKVDESREEFLKKYRRLFSHLNRYAKPMDFATTIIMEEDDAIAIVTRELIAQDPFFSFVGADDELRVRTKGPENMKAGEAYFTTIEGLYRVNTSLLHAKFRKNPDGWGTSESLKEFVRFRPEDAVIDHLFQEVSLYWNRIFEEVPALKHDPLIMRTDLAEDEDPEDGGGVRQNHLLFRPIGLNLFATIVRALLDERLANSKQPTEESVAEAIKGLGALEWRLYRAPWRHLLYVYDAAKGKWRMRNEERNEALACSEKLLRYITGLRTHTTDTLKELRSEWRSLLLDCSEEEADKLWADVVRQSDAFEEGRN